MQPVIRFCLVLLAGTLFGLGLSIARMVDPAKVLNFLDPLGHWDPSLALVMAGGLAVNAALTPFILRRRKPLVAEVFRLPTRLDVDRRIVVGGVIFGIGWGLAGYCPGPIITSLSFVNSDILTVLAAFIAGTLISRWALARSS